MPAKILYCTLCTSADVSLSLHVCIVSLCLYAYIDIEHQASCIAHQELARTATSLRLAHRARQMHVSLPVLLVGMNIAITPKIWLRIAFSARLCSSLPPSHPPKIKAALCQSLRAGSSHSGAPATPPSCRVRDTAPRMPSWTSAVPCGWFS